jgi:hypothetical protein
MATLHLTLDATSAAEHAALAEMIAMRGGRVRTVVRWLEHALGRPLAISVEEYPLEAARAEFITAANRARDVADQCPWFAEQLARITTQAAKATTAEELAVLSRQATDGARAAVNVLLDQQCRAAARRPA